MGTHHERGPTTIGLTEEARMGNRKLAPRFYRAYPELALFGSDAEARAVLKGFRRHLFRTRRFWLYALLAALLSGGMGPLVLFVLRSQLALPRALETLIIGGSAAIVVMISNVSRLY